jgi:Flp pilus assembly protein TadG
MTGRGRVVGSPTSRVPRTRGERGTAALEFALVCPILILLVMGTIEFGLVINKKTVVSNAAREGAREASLNPVAAEVEAVVRSALASIPAGQVTVTVSCRKPDNSACASFNTDATSGGTAVIQVTYVHSLITPLASTFGSTMTVAETSEMRIE